MQTAPLPQIGQDVIFTALGNRLPVGHNGLWRFHMWQWYQTYQRIISSLSLQKKGSEHKNLEQDKGLYKTSNVGNSLNYKFFAAKLVAIPRSWQESLVQCCFLKMLPVAAKFATCCWCFYAWVTQHFLFDQTTRYKLDNNLPSWVILEQHCFRDALREHRGRANKQMPQTSWGPNASFILFIHFFPCSQDQDHWLKISSVHH